MNKTKAVCICIMLFEVHFLNYDVKCPKTFYGVLEHTTTISPFSFRTWIESLKTV